MHDITSTANARVKALQRLRRRRHRDEAGVSVVEGHEELSLAVAAGVAPTTVWRCPELTAADDARAIEAAAGEVVLVPRAVFEKIAYRESPDGWLAVVPAVETALADIALGPGALVLVCEHVEKPGNLGAMLRTADAAGVTAVVSADPVTDWANPNVVRASKGAVFAVPVAAAAHDAVLSWLAAADVALVATTPDAAVPYTSIDLTGPVAIAVGSEKHGLSRALLGAATCRALIPMHGRVDSLNVATSAALLLYEAVRQRAS